MAELNAKMIKKIQTFLNCFYTSFSDISSFEITEMKNMDKNKIEAFLRLVNNNLKISPLQNKDAKMEVIYYNIKGKREEAIIKKVCMFNNFDFTAGTYLEKVSFQLCNISSISSYGLLLLENIMQRTAHSHMLVEENMYETNPEIINKLPEVLKNHCINNFNGIISHDNTYSNIRGCNKFSSDNNINLFIHNFMGKEKYISLKIANVEIRVKVINPDTNIDTTYILSTPVINEFAKSCEAKMVEAKSRDPKNKDMVTSEFLAFNNFIKWLRVNHTKKSAFFLPAKTSYSTITIKNLMDEIKLKIKKDVYFLNNDEKMLEIYEELKNLLANKNSRIGFEPIVRYTTHFNVILTYIIKLGGNNDEDFLTLEDSDLNDMGDSLNKTIHEKDVTEQIKLLERNARIKVERETTQTSTSNNGAKPMTKETVTIIPPANNNQLGDEDDDDESDNESSTKEDKANAPADSSDEESEDEVELVL